jgi:methyl-accepting chemotaxis protein
MANLNELEQQVEELDPLTSSIFRFIDAFDNIKSQALTATGNDLDKLRDILNVFRGRLPDLITHKRLRADSKDLADTMMQTALATRISRINARNAALDELTEALQTQIDKANQDASLLEQIKTAVDSATKTVAEAKAIVDKLTATDATTKDKLKTLIEGLGNISNIFSPPNT